MHPINHSVTKLTSTVENLTDAAVSAVTQQIYERHPVLLQRFGKIGQENCREDLHYHLSYLQAALHGSNNKLFSDYVLWLASVLKSRNVPAGHLPESLQLMQQFFNSQLLRVEADTISAVWQSGIDALTTAPAEPPSYQRLMPAALPQSKAYLQALLNNNRQSALNILLNSLNNETSLIDAGVGVIQPAMYEIGALWQRNRITVAQEHLATAITQHAMAAAFSRADFSAPLQRKAMFACVPANQHSLGLRMVSDAFEISGWDVQYLGADVPDNDLLAQVDLWKPEFLGLSLSLPSHIKTARLLVQKLRTELGTRCPAILSGGIATNQAEYLWKATGSDLWSANAKDSVKEAT